MPQVATVGGVFGLPHVEIELPAGLGARRAAAAVTQRTASATYGNVRVFSGGRMALQIDPEVAYGLVTADDSNRPFLQNMAGD